MSIRKKKLKTLITVLSKCENNINISKNDQIQNIINDIKSSNKLKFIDICKKPYFKTIIDIVFSYYELNNRDADTELVYNYLLQLIDNSVSTEE